MKWFVVFLALLAGSASAQAVVVKSGDHADFTRLVLTFPDAGDWNLGRTEGGYELQLARQTPAYDLTDVYRLITRARLKSIWVDPTSGRLQMGVECACHAIPFEFSQDTLVIDIRDGDPPAGSAFEQSLATGKFLSPLGQTKVASHQSPPAVDQTYNWLDTSPVGSPARAGTPGNADPSPTALDAEVEGDGFRNAVIDQLAKGATDGVVGIVPKGLGENAPDNRPDPANARVTLEAELALDAPVAPPGVAVSDGGDRPPLTEQGEICPSPERVELGSWLAQDQGGDALTAARSAILGEFDQPNAEQLGIAVRTYLYFGFGAEARNLLTAFQPGPEADALVMAITYLVDGQAPPANPFTGMQTCDSAAAFWALAAARSGDALPGLDGSAVARTYLGLPQHLKLAFAHDIVDGLLRSGDPGNAEIVRAALARSAPETSAAVPLLDAEMALREGDPERAEARLESVSDSAMAAEALLALIEARFQQRLALEERDVIAIEGFAVQNRSGARAAAFHKALTHARALGGDFDGAFAAAAEDPGLRNDVWLILGALAQPADILAHAVGGTPVMAETVPAATKATLARKLMEMGLPNAAKAWLPDNPEDLLLKAEVALANKDGRSALKTLAIDMPDADPALLAQAFQETGSYLQAASVLRGAGNPDEAARLERWAGRWPNEAPNAPGETGPDQLAAQGDDEASKTTDAWAKLALLRTPVIADEGRPQLESARAHLDDSDTTRGRIMELLSAVPQVAP